MGLIVNATSALTLTSAHDGATILADATSAGFTISLPYALDLGSVTIKKVDTTDNIVTIQTKGSDLIGAASTYQITEGNSVLVLVSDRETKWWPQGETQRYQVDYRLITASGSILATDFVIGVSGTGDITLTLPSASAVPAGRRFFIHGEATAAAELAVSGAAAETIDGAGFVSVDQQTGSVVVYSNGTAWRTFPSDKV